jgi:hypothetical protein
VVALGITTDGAKIPLGLWDRSHPGAAASLREGMAETLTLTRLGVRGTLKQTLQSTNPCESSHPAVPLSADSARVPRRVDSAAMAD